eukprot:PhM_4_TR11858/c0_g1_i1/m.65910
MEVEFLGAGHSHRDVEDGELACRERADHDAAGAETREAQLLEANVAGEVEQTGGDAARAAGRGALVDERQERVGGVRDDRGGNTGDRAGREGDGHLRAVRGLREVDAGALADGLSGGALDGELGHGVGDLLEQNGAEAGVEALEDAVGGDDLGEGRDEARGKLGVRHETDARGLEGAQEDVGDELGAGGGRQVDTRAVVPCLLLSEGLDHVDLEELHAAELEPALDEVADGRGAEARGETSHALVGDDLLEATQHTAVVLLRVQLDAGLDDVDGAQGTVGDRAADAAGEGTLQVVVEAVLALSNHCVLFFKKRGVNKVQKL